MDSLPLAHTKLRNFRSYSERSEASNLHRGVSPRCPRNSARSQKKRLCCLSHFLVPTFCDVHTLVPAFL